MWYLTWLLGLALACAFTVACGLWYEVHRKELDVTDVDGAVTAAKRR